MISLINISHWMKKLRVHLEDIDLNLLTLDLFYTHSEYFGFYVNLVLVNLGISLKEKLSFFLYSKRNLRVYFKILCANEVAMKLQFGIR